MGSLQELDDPFFVHSADPVVIELNRLHNRLKEKDQELGDAHGEIKALRLTEALKDKAVEELSNEMRKLDDKLRADEILLENKNLEIKKLKNEKKEALAAQFAAEATLRRVHANQKNEGFVPVEALIAPLEAEIKIYKNEIALLHEDRIALERLSKSKESALIEAEKILRSALERVLIVEEVQNHNMELKRQVEICQEENRILDKTNHQKVSEVEKLSRTIWELEESILTGGTAANAVRDCQRQISELIEEKKILERDLARAKVLANRVATVVANEWKDDNDKVMPVKQWLEERRFLQAEMQRLKDKLAVSERTVKAEAQLKEKFRLRLKTLEDGLKRMSTISSTLNASHPSEDNGKSSPMLGFLNNPVVKKRSTSQPRGSACLRKGSPLWQPNVGNEITGIAGQLKRINSLKLKHVTGENMPKKNLWACRSKVLDSAGKEIADLKGNSYLNTSMYTDSDVALSRETKTKCDTDGNAQTNGPVDPSTEDVVSGFLYDRLQREVLNLRQFCEEKDGTLDAKEEEIKMLMWKVDALTKAMEIESRKVKKEATARDKEMALNKWEDNKQKTKIPNLPKRAS